MLESSAFDVSTFFTGSCAFAGSIGFGGDAVHPFAPFRISVELGNRCVEEEEMK